MSFSFEKVIQSYGKRKWNQMRERNVSDWKVECKQTLEAGLMLQLPCSECQLLLYKEEKKETRFVVNKTTQVESV